MPRSSGALRVALAALSAAVALGAPRAAAVALREGDVVVMDAGDADALYRVDPTTGARELISDGGFLDGVQHVAVDRRGRVFASDGNDAALIRIDPARFDPAVPYANQTLVGYGTLLDRPRGLAVAPDGAVYVAVEQPFGIGGRIVRVDPDAYDPLDADANHRVVSQSGLLSNPQDLVIDPDTGMLYAVTFLSTAPGTPGSVVRVDPGAYDEEHPDANQTLVSQGPLLLGSRGLARVADGRLVVVGDSSNVLRVDPLAFEPLDPGANQALVSGSGAAGLWDVDTEASGTLVTTAPSLDQRRVLRVDPDAFDAGDPDANQIDLAAPALFAAPHGVDVVPEPGAGALGAATAGALASLAGLRRRGAPGAPRRRARAPRGSSRR